MDQGEAAKRGLDRAKKRPMHTHGVHYERADNGGVRAHVHKHFGKGPKSEGHSHTEEHVLANHEDVQEHLNDHMGDQPAAGEMPEDTQGQGAAPETAPASDANPVPEAGM